MRIIITGGTGLIGKPLSTELAKDYEVVVLTRSPERHAASMPSSVKLVQWDGKTTAGWGELVDGAFAVINMAGAGIADSRWSPARKDVVMQSRLDAGRAVVAAIAEAENKPTVLLQASAVGYYGNRGDERLTERASAGTGFLAEVCIPWEESTIEVEKMGVRHVILRTGIVLSMRGGALPKLTMPFQFFAGGPLGDGSQWMPWIHMDDQIGAMRYLMEDKDASGPYNICAPAPLQNRAMAQKIGIVMNKPTVLPAPAFAIRLALGEMAAVVLDGQRALPERLIKEGYKFRYADAETALRDIV